MTESPKIFLTASWYHLLLLNYPVDASVLMPYLPKDCEIDLYQGSPYVSLVAFQFRNTKVFGIKWPGFTSFPELNLRFYIRCRGQRGVCFIKEFVPSRLIAGIARNIYNEPYSQATMTENVQVSTETIDAAYTLRYRGFPLRFDVVAGNRAMTPDEQSVEHFFKEHDLGVGRDRAGNTLTYRVHHPKWRIFPIQSFSIDIAAAGIFGEQFSFLTNSQPRSVVFAEGSDIIVYKHI